MIRAGRLIADGPIETLSKTAARRVVLHGVSAPPALEGVRGVQAQENMVSFLYQGEISPLLAALVSLPLTDLSIAEPSLEELFLQEDAQGGERE